MDIMLMKVNLETGSLLSDTKINVMFSDTKINVITEGKRHLGVFIGSNAFRIKYVNEKVTEWCNELKVLSEYAKSQPQAAYAAFCFCEQNKFSFFSRTIPKMNDLMKLVDETVQNFLLTAIFGEAISEKRKRIIFITSSIKSLRYSII